MTPPRRKRIGFWIVDCLDEDSLHALKKALKKAANTAQMSEIPLEDFDIGLACVRLNATAKVELKILLSPGRMCLSNFHAAVDQLQPSDERSDQQKLAAVLKKIMERLPSDTAAGSGTVMSRRDGEHSTAEEYQNEIHVVSMLIESGPSMIKVLKQSSRRGVRIHFHLFISDAVIRRTVNDDLRRRIILCAYI